jgi:methylmalonyl-CoA epimerase
MELPLSSESSHGEMTTIKKIDHIGIAVRNIEETLAFYERFGLRPAHSEAEPEQRVVVAFLPAGESEVELIEPIDEDGPVARFLAKRGEGMHHICFEVEDIESVLRALEQEGIGLIDAQPRLGTGGKRIAFVHPRSAHGVLIELYERAPGERKPPLVDLDALRERLLLETEAARAGLQNLLSSLQRRIK